MPARWEDDTLPRASIPSPANQEDRARTWHRAISARLFAFTAG